MPQYAHLLLNQSLAFVGSGGPIPPKLWHYRHANLSAQQLQATRAFLLRDEPGRVCGIKDGRVAHWGTS